MRCGAGRWRPLLCAALLLPAAASARPGHGRRVQRLSKATGAEPGGDAHRGHNCKHHIVHRLKPRPLSVAQDYGDRRRAYPEQQVFDRQGMRIKWFWGEECLEERTMAMMQCYCKKVGDIIPSDAGSEKWNQTCEQAGVVDARKKQYVDDIMKLAVEWFSRALLVTPVRGSLRVSGQRQQGCAPGSCPQVPYCGVTVSQEHVSAGVEDADHVIYISAVPTEGDTLAWAWTCLTDQSERPIATHVNFGAQTIDPDVATDSIEYRNYVGVAVHEIMHGLGFSDQWWEGDYPTWFVDHCSALGRQGCKPYETRAERGQAEVHRIVTPEVVRTLREYSGCYNLTGAEIENEGDAGSKGSHWEKRIFGNEGMTPSSGLLEGEWSPMTLAYFKDTGHYDVDYSQVSADYAWGRGKGCSFWNDKCNEIEPELLRFPEYCFPRDPTQVMHGCDFHLIGPADCDVDNVSNGVPTEFKYFADHPTYGAVSNFVDHCPTFTAGYRTETQCFDPSDAVENILVPDSAGNERALEVTDKDLGVTREVHSRCFLSNLKRVGLSDRAQGDLDWFSQFIGDTRCLRVSCAADCLSYTVYVTGPTRTERLTCDESSKNAQLPAGFADRWSTTTGDAGSRPYVQCWPISDICGLQARSQLGFHCPTPAPPPPSPPPAPPPPSPPPSLLLSPAEQLTTAAAGLRPAAATVLAAAGALWAAL
eukprot:TRINITY_DN2361_c2_g1_i1.p1 TRINITY_DN2361_c2_g1~~TRINITY_DN2361_c2_g1_i1.p1  ORF type:complete len:727 (+),score=129.15 TRINITY_DN2361_c2_g1_i1:78-2183(+)